MIKKIALLLSVLVLITAFPAFVKASPEDILRKLIEEFHNFKVQTEQRLANLETSDASQSAQIADLEQKVGGQSRH